MRNILLTVSYDGRGFCGWQRQKGKRTVQEEIERALAAVHKEPVALHGSGRTDSGVHAVGQAANFQSPVASIPAEKYLPALHSLLPRDIRIVGVREVPESFHARFDATERTYKYFIYCGKTPPAHILPFVWAVHRQPDVARLNRMAAALSGEIDCTVFSAAGDQSKSRSRYLNKAVFCAENGLLVFEISANAFLWKMVRSIVGTLLLFEQKGFPPEYFAETLASADRSRAGPPAPPDGLFLWHVGFDGVRRGPARGGSEKMADATAG